MRFLLIFLSLLQYKLSYSAEIKLSSFDKIAAKEFLNLAENIPNRQQLLGAFENSVKQYEKSFGASTIKPKNYGTIRIGTFNVQSWLNFNGKNYDPEKTMRFITSLDVDVLAIQEYQKLDSKLFARFLEQMRVPKNRYVHSNDLALISRFPIEESRSLDIETDGCAMLTKIKLPDETLNIVNLHLSWKDETGEVRASEIEKILKELKDNEVNIILGDFNAVYSDQLSPNLKSLIEKIDEDREESTYLAIPSPLREYVEAGSILDQSLQFSCWSMRRVDHIFFPDFLKKRVLSSQVVPSLVSDHFPLLLDLKVDASKLILNGPSAQKHAELMNFRDVEALKSEDYVNLLAII